MRLNFLAYLYKTNCAASIPPPYPTNLKKEKGFFSFRFKTTSHSSHHIGHMSDSAMRHLGNLAQIKKNLPRNDSFPHRIGHVADIKTLMLRIYALNIYEFRSCPAYFQARAGLRCFILAFRDKTSTWVILSYVRPHACGTKQIRPQMCGV
jgi:hypothetical protein